MTQGSGPLFTNLRIWPKCHSVAVNLWAPVTAFHRKEDRCKIRKIIWIKYKWPKEPRFKDKSILRATIFLKLKLRIKLSTKGITSTWRFWMIKILKLRGRERSKRPRLTLKRNSMNQNRCINRRPKTWRFLRVTGRTTLLLPLAGSRLPPKNSRLVLWASKKNQILKCNLD